MRSAQAPPMEYAFRTGSAMEYAFRTGSANGICVPHRLRQWNSKFQTIFQTILLLQISLGARYKPRYNWEMVTMVASFSMKL